MNNLINRLSLSRKRLDEEIRRALRHRSLDTIRLLRLIVSKLVMKGQLYLRAFEKRQV